MKKDQDYKDHLTNEQLLKRFKNQFELVRYAIQLAENCVRAGREPDIFADSQNVAFNILSEIAAHTEHFIELPQPPVVEPKPFESHRQDTFSKGFSKNSSSNSSWSEEVKAFKEEKKERKMKPKART